LDTTPGATARISPREDLLRVGSIGLVSTFVVHTPNTSVPECPSAKERRIVMSKIGDSIAETSDRRLEDEFFLWKKDYKKKMKSDIKTKKNKKKLIIGIFLLVVAIFIINQCFQMYFQKNVLLPNKCCDGSYVKNNICTKCPAEHFEDCKHCRKCYEIFENKKKICNEEYKSLALKAHPDKNHKRCKKLCTEVMYIVNGCRTTRRRKSK
jgi:hypothetical protein